jgi:hypothetical protein
MVPEPNGSRAIVETLGFKPPKYRLRTRKLPSFEKKGAWQLRAQQKSKKIGGNTPLKHLD